MKTKLTSPKTTGLILALAGFALSAPAIPIPISGSISFSGTTAIDSASFDSATRFTEFQDVTVGAPSSLSGAYVGTSGAAVTVAPFIWAPPTASTPIQPLWTFISGGDTYSFSLSTFQVQYVTATDLLLSGTGTATITGPGLEEETTTGIWDFSAQTLDLASFTFSSTTTVPPSVSDGGKTIAMLGGVFVCLGLLRRRIIIP